MLSIDYIRKNKNKVIKAGKDKNRKIDVEKILKLDDEQKNLIQKIQVLREQRNLISKKGTDEKNIKKGKEIKKQLKKIEKNLFIIQESLNTLLYAIPNVPLEEVPVGTDYSKNKEIKKWGEIPKFPFEYKSHIELGKSLNIVDFERGSKVSGYRGYFLKNELAIVHLALLFYAFNKLTSKGYTPLIPPAIVKGFTLFGSGQFPWGEKDVYKLNDEDAYLEGTAEIPVTAYYSNEILYEKDLPKKMVALAPSYRREAGAHGKDTKGLYRVHEFWKVEQVILGKNNVQEAIKYHEELQQNAEEILEDLNLPYRVLLMCTGEMGEPQIKKYDIEVWMPSRKSYGEIMSNSIMGDFQTRRLNIKYRDINNQIKYCFSLNNTFLPSPRILIAILENYQQKDGSVLIPKVLQKYTGFEKITKK
jgi:seryl-tRNA synthetase